MTTVNDILMYLETLAPRSMKMDWDNVGLLCGSRTKAVTTVLVALDPFESICHEASDIGAELIVTHHPLIFSPAKAITDDNSVGRAILHLASRGISAINAHTNLDCAPGGVNDILAHTLELEDIEVVKPSGIDDEGRPWGLLRCGTVREQSLEQFLGHVKTALGCPGLRYASCGKPVHKVAVGGGACGGEFMDAVAAGCDTFVTADVRYNQFWDAQDAGLNIIDAGHFHTENPICAQIARKLQAQFPQIRVEISQKHTDCVKFY